MSIKIKQSYLVKIFLTFYLISSTVVYGQAIKNIQIELEGCYYPIKKIRIQTDKKDIIAKYTKYFNRVPVGTWKVVVETYFESSYDTIISFTNSEMRKITLNSQLKYSSTKKLELDEPIINKMNTGDTLILLCKFWTKNTYHDALQVIRTGPAEFKAIYYQENTRKEKMMSIDAIKELGMLEYKIKHLDKTKTSNCWDAHFNFDLILGTTRYSYFSSDCAIMDFEEFKNFIDNSAK